MTSNTSSAQAQRPNAGQDCEDSRTVMMEKDSEVSRRRVLVALLFTEDGNDSQNRMHTVLTIHPTLAYPFFSLI